MGGTHLPGEGGQILYYGGKGGAANSGFDGARGGVVTFNSGIGGDGSATKLSGQSGNIVFRIADPGTDGGFGVGTKGTIIFQGASQFDDVASLMNTATPPVSSTDAAILYSADISAGNATLGIFTETAVATDAALVSANSLTVYINGSLYKLMLAAP